MRPQTIAGKPPGSDGPNFLPPLARGGRGGSNPRDDAPRPRRPLSETHAMTRFLVITAGLLAAAAAPAQDGARYGILPNDDLYKQKAPKDALAAVILAIERDRLDYLVAHLMPKDFVDARLKRSAAYFEKIAAEQLAGTAQGAGLTGAELQARVQQKAEILNFRHLTDTMRTKLADEPDNLKTLKRFLREGDVVEAGDTATVTVKDVKDRTVYLRKVDGRWVFENRREEPAKE